MIRSMTGFGRGSAKQAGKEFTVEIKSVNNRYCDIFVKLPKYISFLEERVRNILSNKLSRGKVEVYITFQDTGDNSKNIIVDIPLVNAYLRTAKFLKESYDIKDDVSAFRLMTIQDIIKVEKVIHDEDELVIILEQALNQAVVDLLGMREREGLVIRTNLLEKLSFITENLEEIKKGSLMVVEQYRNKLENRIKELVSLDIVDQSRIAFEVAVFADKASIDEEIVRLKSHIEQFENTLKSDEPVGRRLDFIIQEMNREINTIGSKAANLYIIKNVIDVKNELEKLREQVQNIE